MGAIEDVVEIEAIKKIRTLYSHYFDNNQFADLAELFTEDAVCEFGEAFGGDWVGRETIRRNYEAVHGENPRPFMAMHAVTNNWVELTGPDTATGRSYLLDLSLSPEVANPLLLIGLYVDQYRKIGGKWLIHRTRIDFLWPRRDSSAARPRPSAGQ